MDKERAQYTLEEVQKLCSGKHNCYLCRFHRVNNGAACRFVNAAPYTWDLSDQEQLPASATPQDQDQKADAVSHPDHYTKGGIECKDALLSMVSSWDDPGAAALAWNVVKYIWRHMHKGNPVQDLKKARQYLDWMIERAERSVNE